MRAKKIQIDRYNNKSEDVAIQFLDTTNRFLGWKTVLINQISGYNIIVLISGRGLFKTVTVRAISGAGATLQVRVNNINGLILSEIKIS